MVRSSHPEVFLGKGVLKICSKFTGEHPCRSGISISCKEYKKAKKRLVCVVSQAQNSNSKSPENHSCIDLFLTNSRNSFQNSGVVEAGLSDFHRIIVTVMKTSFQR